MKADLYPAGDMANVHQASSTCIFSFRQGETGIFKFIASFTISLSAVKESAMKGVFIGLVLTLAMTPAAKAALSLIGPDVAGIGQTVQLSLVVEYGDQFTGYIWVDYPNYTGGLGNPFFTGNVRENGLNRIDIYGLPYGFYICAVNFPGSFDVAPGPIVTFDFTSPAYAQIADTYSIDLLDLNFSIFYSKTITIGGAIFNLTATNNWDGKIALSWTSGAGSVKIYRKKDSGSFQYVKTVSGSSYTDKVDEPGKNYTYELRNSSGTTISNTTLPVKAEVVVVLVRGYSPTASKAVNDKYWKVDGDDEVVDVKQWFSDRGVTCWEPLQGYTNGDGLSGWKSIAQNTDELEDFIDSQRIGSYSNAKINLIGHSMGGLISRKYVNDNPNIIVNNIFCIQTPHTGSPLAGLEGYWNISRAVLSYGTIYNRATPNLTYEFLNSFNTNLRSTNLYLFYSDDWKKEQDDGWLDNTNGIINNFRRYSIDEQEQSDGVVPYLSGLGKYYQERTRYCSRYGTYYCSDYPLSEPYIVTKEWDTLSTSIFESVADTMNSGLDHYTGHRHKKTLNKIMQWLGLPYTASTTMSTLTIADIDLEAELPLYYISGFTGEIDSSNPASKTVIINDSTVAVFRVLTSDVNYLFTLEDPYGVIYDPTYAATEPNVNYELDGEIAIYEVNEPIAGLWTLNLTTTVASPNFVGYGLTVFEDTVINLHSYTDVDWANTDADILVLSDLSTNTSPILSADVMAEITLPDSTTASLVLYDDGLHNDANSADGLYANTFTDTSQTGKYAGFVIATGLLDGVDFERSTSLSFTISSPDIQFDGNINDVGVDLNANGLHDVLRFTIPVNVFEPNEYLLTTSLLDSSDSLIKLLSSGSLTLPVGANTFTLEVTAEEIVTHGVNGPYILSDITISDADTGLTIADANDYTTAAYLVSDFEPLDTDEDGLSDNLELSIGSDINLLDSDFDGLSDYEEISYDGDANSYNLTTDLNPISPDTDSDGMDDGWEINFGYDPLVDDGAKNNDDDSDGLLNLGEFQNSTLPNNSDTDSDGISDGSEINVYSTNPTNIDTDLDGLTDGDEVNIYGTIPTNPDTDGDTIMDGIDNCKLTSNSDQSDLDGDVIGDLCDNCPSSSNSEQNDMDSDGKGDECDCLADLSNNNFIDLEDFTMFALHWLEINCTTPDYCSATDFDKSGTVDSPDLAEIAAQWLENVTP